MNISGSLASSYVDVVQKKVVQNTAQQVVESRQAGQPIDKEQIQQSNQAIKQQALSTGADLYSASQQKQLAETYVQASQNAQSATANNEGNANNEISSFDPQKVNEARNIAQRRAIGVAIYENQQAANHPTTPFDVASSGSIVSVNV